MRLTGLVAILALIIPAAFAESGPDGKELYQQYCATCHEGGVAKAPELSMLKIMSPVSILSALESGVMKEQAAAISDDGKRRIAEYLTGRSIDDAAMAMAPMCSGETAEFDFSAPPDARGWGVNIRNHRYFGEDVAGVTADNIEQLELKWAFAFPGAVRARSQPATAGGSLFVGSQDGTVYSLDQETGCIRWQFSTVAEVRTAIVVSDWEPGSEQNPLLYFGDLVGNVYALDAVTGELVWRDRADDHPSLTLTAAPALYKDRLYVPLSSLEVTAAGEPDYPCCTFRGGVAVYEAGTGEKVDISYTIDEKPEVVGENAIGTPQLAPSGSPVWNTPSLDIERGVMYVGTGENYSSPANDTSDAILALSLDDFSIVWSRQMTEGDAWNMGCETEERINCPAEDGPDYDFGAATILVTTEDGRDMILAGQKSGEVFALDPDNEGEIIWQNKLGRGGIQGGVHFGMAVEGDILYVPMSDFEGGDRWPGEPFPGMFAVDINTGETLWYNRWDNRCEGRHQYCQPGISAAVSAIDGAVVAGGMDGILRAYDKTSGKVIWEYDSVREYETLGGGSARGGSFGGGAGPVFKDDMMYVNSGYGIYFHIPGNVLLAFELKESEVTDN